MKIALIGPPGSGKGTFAAEISRRHKTLIIAIGSELRKMANTKIGKMLKEKYWKKGKLIPSKYAMNILKKRITKNGYILDGFPREIKEAKLFDKLDQLDAVISLKVSQKTILDRLHGRLQCKKCGRIYHIKNHPPKKDLLCDVCKLKLYEREDDKDKKVIKERFNVYRKETKPVIKYYKKKGLLREINGEASVSKVVDNIEKIIKKKKIKGCCL